MNIVRTATTAILYIGIFLASLYRPLDPDLGWHLKYGEYFFKTGSILRENIFSVAMPDHRWNNSSWVTDLLSYSSFHTLGFLGLTLLGALVVTATLWFFYRAFRIPLWSQVLLSPIVLILQHPVNSVSFRGQLVSYMLVGVLWYILSFFNTEKKKVVYILPILFLIWSNVHGAYALGLGLFGLWLGFSVFQHLFLQKESLKSSIIHYRTLFLLFFLSCLSVMVNPFGTGVYDESLRHFGFSGIMQREIVEWTSLEIESPVWWQQIFAGCLMMLGVFLLGMKSRLKESSVFVAIAVILFVLSLSARRYAWPAYYTGIILFAPVTQFFMPRHKRKKDFPVVTLVLSVLFLASVVLVKYPFSQYTSMNWNTYCNTYLECSNQAIERYADVKVDPSLTVYDWGGYMIWNYPSIKPYIDGRMPAWEDENGYRAFDEYISYETGKTSIEDSSFNTVLISKSKMLYFKLEELIKKGTWTKEYEDQYSAIYIRTSR